MYSPTQGAQDNETDRPLVSYNLSIKRLDIRSALVIEKSDVLREQRGLAAGRVTGGKVF